MLDSTSLDKILRSARSHNGFQDRPVTDAQLRELYEISVSYTHLTLPTILRV